MPDLPQEIINFLSPWAYVPICGLIASLVQLLKTQVADLGKLSWIYALALSMVFSVGQCFVLPLMGIAPLQSNLWHVILMGLGTALGAVGLHSTLKNAKQAILGKKK